MLAILFFTLPSVSFAAALTTQQSTSLIAVVQSSPGTPASAFVSLITAFSNITVNQATSLITVVQAAPGVPAGAFVNLLVSFTEDTSATQSTTPTAVVVPTVTPQVTNTPDSTGSTLPQITNVQITTSLTSAAIEWETNKPTDSKIFISGGNISTAVYKSESGVSTRHVANATGLSGGTTYSYEIEAIAGGLTGKKQGSFATKPLPAFTSGPTPTVTLKPLPAGGDYRLSVEWTSNGASFVSNICSPGLSSPENISPVSVHVNVRTNYNCSLKIQDSAGNSLEKKYSFTVGPGFISTSKIDIPSGLSNGESVSIYRFRINNLESRSYATSTLIKSLTLKLKKSALSNFSINSISGTLHPSALWELTAPYSQEPKLSFFPTSFSDFTDEKTIVFDAPIRIEANVSEYIEFKANISSVQPGAFLTTEIVGIETSFPTDTVAALQGMSYTISK